MAPIKHRAAVLQEDGTIAVKEMDVPKPDEGEILVKIVATAQNPGDWKIAKNVNLPGSVMGFDFAGVLEDIGPGVPTGLVTVGKRVAAFIYGGFGPNGAFAEYATARADRILRVPDSWSFEDAAQLGVAPLTATQMLWESQEGLPTPLSPSTWEIAKRLRILLYTHEFSWYITVQREFEAT